MSEQVFISYRREGGDITAKLICESLKNHGYTVFYDFDSISGGYFDERIITAIENCNDFLLVLPKNSLDRCNNENDWVRQEIACAMKCGKNIIPVMLPDFVFPAQLPAEIENISRINAVQFVMAYFEGVISAIIDRLISKPKNAAVASKELPPSENLEFVMDKDRKGYAVKRGTCTDGVVVIPRSYQGAAVVAIAEDAFRECGTVSKVVLPDTIQHIGKHAFYKCTLLKEVNIPNKVTEIGGWAFYECTSLKKIIIPESVKTIGNYAFANCEAMLRYEVAEDNDTFCAADNNLYSKDKKTLHYYACGNQETHFSIPEGVTKIGNAAFSWCAALVSVTIPDSVQKVGSYTFRRCTSLTSITIPDGVQTLGEDIFRGCSALEEVNLPDSIKTLEYGAFYECASLKELKTPENLASIGDWGFYKCSALRGLHLSQSVQSIGNIAFDGCKSLKQFTVDPRNACFCSVQGHLFTRDMRTLVAYARGSQERSYEIPAGVTAIADTAFSYCAALETVKIPESVNTIGEYAFMYCKSLVKVNVPASVTVLERDVFGECSGLVYVDIPKTVTAIKRGAFYKCNKLESVNIPDKVTEIGPWAIYRCTKLKNLSLPKSLGIIDNRALAGCSSLTDISVGMFNKAFRVKGKALYTKDMKRLVQYAIGAKENILTIPEGVEIIGDSSVWDAANLEYVNLPASIKVLEDWAFDNCTRVRQVNFAGTVQMWKEVKIGECALRKLEAKEIKCSDGTVKI